MLAYQPLTPEAYDSPATSAYIGAYDKLKERDPAAFQDFAALVGTYGEDPLANFHLKRLLAGETGAEVVFSEK